MPRPAELTARQVAELKPRPSAYRIAQNLYLDHPAPGRKSWLFRYTSPESGKPITMGLGPAEFVTVPDAKAKAGELRAALYYGRDPLAERRRKAVPRRSHTFEECLALYIAAHRASWDSEHTRQWDVSVRTYAAGLLSMPVARIEVADVMASLEQHWHAKTATVSRVRGRVESVLSYARSRGWRSGDNPARWRGLLDQMLPSVKRLKPVQHHAALDWKPMPAFYAELAVRPDTDVAALALRLLALTAVRRGEALAATWDEINRDTATWIIPVDHTKSKRIFRVPLSTEALVVIDQLDAMRLSDAAPTSVITPHAIRQGDVLLPGRIPGRPIAATVLLDLMRALRPGATIHGLRSSFRDWAANHGVADREAEFALAHVEGSETVRAYQRDDLLEPRRAVMARWASHLTGGADA